MQEIENEELERILGGGVYAVKAAIFRDGEFRITETVELLDKIESALPDAAFYIYCPNLMTQAFITAELGYTRSALAGRHMHTMHLDTLPYSSVIVAVPAEQEGKLRDLLFASGVAFDAVTGL